MNGVYKLIQSPEWWITVVIAGILINLFSSYLRKVLDNRFSRTFSWWRDKSQKRKMAREKYINRLKSDTNYLLIQAIEENRYRSWAIMWALLSSMCFLSAQIVRAWTPAEIVLMCIGALSFFRGFIHLIRATYVADCIYDVIEKDQKEI